MSSHGSISDSYSETRTSPDGQVVLRAGVFSPIGRGGPHFGEIRFPGHDLALRGRQWSEHIAFSPDSRCVALVELVDAGPSCNVVVFDFKQRLEIAALRLSPGYIRGLSWRGDAKLEMDVWTLEHDAHTFTWALPKPSANTSWWQFWRKRRQWSRVTGAPSAQRIT